MDKENLANLLRILKLIGGKFIIVEDEVPRYVLMGYDEFQELAAPAVEEKLAKRLKQIEAVNQQITHAQLLDLREEVIVEAPQEIRIEPL